MSRKKRDFSKEIEQAARIADAKAALFRLGVSRSQIEELIRRHDLKRIEQQLLWLPHRKARKPSSLIVAAIQQDYEQPAALEAAANSSSDSLPDGKDRS